MNMMQMAGVAQGRHHHHNNMSSMLQMQQQMMQQQMMQQQTPNMQPMAMNQNNYFNNSRQVHPYAGFSEPIQATAVPSSTESNTAHIADEIEKLATLRNRGVMTEQEYADAKSKLLAKL